MRDKGSIEGVEIPPVEDEAESYVFCGPVLNVYLILSF